MISINRIERALARKLPTDFAKDFYPRAMRRLAEYGLFRGLHKVDTRHGFQMFVDRLDVVKWYIYYFSEFEPQISLAWKRLLQPGDVVLDIGANVGYHSLLAAKAVGPKGQVFSIEPGERIHAQLTRHLGLNHLDNVTVIKKAVSDTRETAKFYYGGDNGQGNSSLIGEGDQPFDLVECIPFADLAEVVPLEKVRLIKIDVEGAEERVINGMASVLDKLSPDVVLFVEISPENAGDAERILKPLTDAGFAAKLVENEYHTGFYRAADQVNFHPARYEDKHICDVVLTRDPTAFDKMAG